jgi:membrane-bound metal-dependent hydrolase YbcI (DUF457 family)
MSWAAHELESYFIQKHLPKGLRISYLAVLLGCLLPDLFTKLPVYGVDLGPIKFKAAQPWAYHRGFPGVGFTHSLAFGVVFATVVLAIARSRAWFLGLILGSAAHVLTDIFDSVGTMVFFPFTTQHYSTGMWAYAAQEGRYGDAAAYYSSLGGVWDFFWLCLALLGWRVFTADYFFGTVVPADGAWAWLRRRFSFSDRTLLALYRAFFIYGSARIFAWFAWAHWIDHAPLDLSWGGPYWVVKAPIHHVWSAGFVLNTLRGASLFAFAMWYGWRHVGRPLWDRAGPDNEPAAEPGKVT